MGCGQFCSFFVLLFKAHPKVKFIAECDNFPDCSKGKFGAYMILTALMMQLHQMKLNSVAIFT